ncbi:ANTAR domain-containing protein [Cellulosimicrobium sp. PMB13]|uniref:ANTAR domain-containing protein n=1 Tax=Cellulosimicrobium sp. PMB13 TaxID=3120158 RepID=UPI003F4BEC3E
MDKVQVLARLASSIAGTDRDAPLSLRLCRACVEILGARGGAITLSPADAERWTVSATDGVAARLEDLEEVLGAGPGRQVSESGRAVVLRLADDVTDGLGEYVHEARRIAGPATLYALPMLPVPHMIGVVVVYQDDDVELGLNTDDRQFLADAVGAALLRDADVVEGTDTSSWPDRARVHQATGMVVAQLGLSAEDALVLLRAHAFADGTTLEELASVVLARRFDFSRTDDTPGASDHDENEGR